MTTTPTAQAIELAAQLTAALTAINTTYATAAGLLVEPVKQEQSFDTARQLLADIEYIQERTSEAIKSFALADAHADDNAWNTIADITNMWPLYNAMLDHDPILVAEEMLANAVLEAKFGDQ